MDKELLQMENQIRRFSCVRLRRIKNSPRQQPQQDDAVLLLGLILILTMDGCDKTLIMMLLYIFS